MKADDPVLVRLRASHDQILARLVEFASIPSVSADPAHAADIGRAARSMSAAWAGSVLTLGIAANSTSLARIRS